MSATGVKQHLHGQVASRTIGRPGVQVAASRGGRFMAQGCLHKVDREASVEGVAGVGMSEPARQSSTLEPWLRGCVGANSKVPTLLLPIVTRVDFDRLWISPAV